MGVDAQIRFTALRGDDELNDVAYDLARWCGADQFYAHPCIEYRESGDWEEAGYYVQLWSRHYGVNYERGSWPLLRSILVWLDAHVVNTEYADDSSDNWRAAAFVIAENDHHWLTEGYPYRWNEWSKDDPLPPGCERPVDAYGKPMQRFGWGNGYASFSSPGDGTERRWRDGAWVKEEVK